MTPRPKSSKVKYQLAIRPHIMKTLKALSAHYGRPVGEVIEGLVNTIEFSSYVKDADFRRRFQGLLGMAMGNTGDEGAWIPEGVDPVAYSKEQHAKDLAEQKAEMERELKDLE